MVLGTVRLGNNSEIFLFLLSVAKTCNGSNQNLIGVSLWKFTGFGETVLIRDHNNFYAKVWKIILELSLQPFTGTCITCIWCTDYSNQ